MRQQHQALQCQLTATLLAVFIATLAFCAPSVLASDADTSTNDGVKADDEPKGLDFNIFGGNGLPFSLDSFNGLALRDGTEENDHEGLFGLDKVRRAVGQALENNVHRQGGVNVGEVQYWYITSKVVNGPHGNHSVKLPSYINEDNTTALPADVGWLRKREGGLDKRSSTVYLSLTTCTKPSTNQTNTGDFEQLEVYVSTSKKNQSPGPGKDNALQQMAQAKSGYLNMEFEAEDDVYIGVAAPNSTKYSGNYGFYIAISIDDYYFKTVELEYDDSQVLYFVDSDQSAALLVTDNLTQSTQGSENFEQWMHLTPPYMMWAQNTNDTAIDGLEMSVCALNGHSLIKSNAKDDVVMTKRGLGNKPKQQFYMKSLNSSSNYWGTLGTAQNSTSSDNTGFSPGFINGGGTVWPRMNFSTKIENNCAVLYNLTFCDEVAYAVPSHPDKSNEDLRRIYDNYTSTYFQNFNYSLQQTACEADNESKYSLSVGCDDCRRSYKQWLCSVSIPRCADFSSNDSYSQIRNAGQAFVNGTKIPDDSQLRKQIKTNVSRNAIIDQLIQPGPYREILPCQDICTTMVKDCPASLSFGCPTGELLNASYGYRNSEGIITCSYLGAAFYLNLGARLGVWGGFYILAGMWGLWALLW